MNTPIQSAALRCTHSPAHTEESTSSQQGSRSFCSNHLAKIWLTLSLGLTLLSAGSGNAATFAGIYGSGADVAFVTLESHTIGLRSYQVNFTFSASDPFDGFDALSLIDAGDPLLDITFINFGSTANPNYFISAISFDGNAPEVSSSTSPFVPFWGQWAAGGEAGFPIANAIADDSWTFGSGISSPFRILENGSNEALVFGDGSAPPSIDPIPLSFRFIPEPSSLVLLILGLSCISRVRRRG